jgi:hypothetical protein
MEKRECVMAGLVPAIHDFSNINNLKTWIAGTRPAMTGSGLEASRQRRIPSYWLRQKLEFPHSLDGRPSTDLPTPTP